MSRRPTFVGLGLAIGLMIVLGQSVAVAQELPEPHPDLPDTYKQMLPRGRIAAIDEPKFVSAGEAEIEDDAWILGVELGGQARAYSLNLLNKHEIVNDKIGDTSFAAVW